MIVKNTKIMGMEEAWSITSQKTIKLDFGVLQIEDEIKRKFNIVMNR